MKWKLVFIQRSSHSLCQVFKDEEPCGSIILTLDHEEEEFTQLQEAFNYVNQRNDKKAPRNPE